MGCLRVTFPIWRLRVKIPCFRNLIKLEILECVKHDHRELWMQYFEGNKNPLLDELSRLNYTASLDFPIIAIFDDLLEVLKFEEKSSFYFEFVSNMISNHFLVESKR